MERKSAKVCNFGSLYLDISSATINFVKLWIIIAKMKLHKIVLSTSTNLLTAKTLGHHTFCNNFRWQQLQLQQQGHHLLYHHHHLLFNHPHKG